MSNAYTQVYLHLVWATKKRFPYLIQPIRGKAHKYIRSIVEKREYDDQIRLVAIGGIEDHIHLLIRVNKMKSVIPFIAFVKSRSSKFINEISGDLYQFAWQEGYGNKSVSPEAAKVVSDYIHNQEEHHKTKSYANEIKKLFDV